MNKPLTRLSQYAAATAAILAIPTEAKSQINYQDIDPDAYIDIDYDDYYLDMNDDGISDFKFQGRSYYFSTAEVSDTYFVDVVPLELNSIAFAVQEWVYCYSSSWCWTNDERVAPKLYAGDIIDTSLLDFTNEQVYLGVDRYGSGSLGFWGTDTNYLAVKLEIDDEPHYGYIHMYTYHPSESWGHAIIYDFAYNSNPNEPIIVGDTLNCTLPDMTSSITTPSAFKLFFDDTDGANQFKVRYRAEGTDSWMLAKNSLPNVVVDGLDCSATYEYKYKVACGMDDIVKGTAWSPVATITTDDCRVGYFTDFKANIYPNPASDGFSIQSVDGVFPETVRILNQNGELITEYYQPNTLHFQTNSLPSGLYLVQIQFSTGTANEMLLIER